MGGWRTLRRGTVQPQRKLPLAARSCPSVERSNRTRFILENVENRIQLRHFQKLKYLRVRTKQLQTDPLVTCARHRSHQLTNTGAIYIRDSSEIQQNILLPLFG